MKSGKIRTAVLFILVLSLLAAFPALVFAKKPIEIKANTFHPVGHTLTEDAFKWYGKEIEKRTNGQVKFTWFLASSLIPFAKTYEGLKSGIADWAYIVPAFNPNEFVFSNVINLPFAAVNSAHAAAILWQLSMEFPELLAEYKKVKPLFFYSTAPVHIHTNTKSHKPRTLEDLKGLRLGCPGPGFVKFMNTLDMAGQRISPGDLYTSVQRGMIDGVMFPEAPMRSQKLTDLVDYHLMMSIGVDVMTVSMNMKSWKKLPKDVQQVFMDISKSAGALFGATITNESVWVIDELKKRGDIFYYLPDSEKKKMKAKLKPFFDEWVEKAVEKGLDAEKILKRTEEIAEETWENPYKPDAWWSKAGKKM